MACDKSIPQIAVEFNVAKSSVSKWVNEYKEECLYTTSKTAESNEAKEIRRLNQLLNENSDTTVQLLICMTGQLSLR